MIRWLDIYDVVKAMLPLYVPLFIGYGSVKLGKLFTSEESEAINRLVYYFTLPFFTFEFTAHVDPFTMNFRFIFADAISKLLIALILAFWAKFCSKGSYSWYITRFSLCTSTNSLVVGVPSVKAMYGPSAVDLVVQSTVVQATVWLPILLSMYEFHKSGITLNWNPSSIAKNEKDLEENIDGRPSFWPLTKTVCFKLAKNPNIYACLIGLSWAFISNRWHIQMPSIMEGPIQMISKATPLTAMFYMGLFMAHQNKLIACGIPFAIVGMGLRFLAAPVAMAIGSIAVGLRGDVLRVAIIQAALPQSITSFFYAKEYELDADVLSTAVIFGMMVSLPVLIGYNFVLHLGH